MSLPRLLVALFVVAGLCGGAVSEAQPQPESTRVVVHAAANDAKLMHDPVGGAFIRIEDTETGEVLAEGWQKGTSGSTDKIVRQPRERGTSIYDTADAATFDTTLALSEPRTVTVTASGPGDYPHAQQRASKTVLLVPGQDLSGDGIELVLHGFIVEVLRPEEGSMVSGEELDVRARVRMMCGCPTEPGGLWNADRYTIRAEVLGPEGGVLTATPLSFTGTTSEYEGTVSVPSDGAAQLRVLAVDAERANAGTATVELTGTD